MISYQYWSPLLPVSESSGHDVQTLATGGYDSAQQSHDVRLWDVASGQLQTSFHTSGSWVRTLIFSEPKRTEASNADLRKEVEQLRRELSELREKAEKAKK